MATADVTIRGAGIFGLSVAWACQKRGARVQVIDPHGPAAGASGGIVGALAPHVPDQWNPKKAFQLESLLMAAAFWQEVSEAGGKPTGYTRSGRLQPLPDDRAVALARDRGDSARTLWQGHATWEVTATGASEWEPPSASGLMVRDTLSALIHPRQATTALAAALRARGGVILPDGPASGQEVWATGWQGLAPDLGNGVKGQAALLELAAPGAPQLFVDGIHIVPHLDGTTAIGSTSEREFTAAGTVDAQLDDLLARATAAMPLLAKARVIDRWAGVRPRAQSRAPLLGRHPQIPGSYIANGGFKIGFGMAPKVGEVMADLILEGIDNIPAGFGAGP